MYKNGKIYYTSVTIKKKRIYASLKTTDRKIAKARERQKKIELYKQLTDPFIDKRKDVPSRKKLVEQYIKYKKSVWAKSTYRTNYYILTATWLRKRPLPKNLSTRESYSRQINAFLNWSNKRYKTNFKKLPNVTGDGRTRVYDDKELELILYSKRRCNYFRQVIDKDLLRLTYATGARQGEILNIQSIHKGYMICIGKRGRRVVKLTKQAQVIADRCNWKSWNWTPDTLQKAFNLYAKKLNIDNAMFKDIRRTFGLNYILNGGMIFQLSKLLGHSKISTTEKHYAPLLAIFVDNFSFKQLK
tara:strand:- start:2124 stop:3026 length:903 start_codon:yes stop_codon:yes gene_type:complete